MSEPERLEVSLPIEALDQLHERLDRTRWPDQPAGEGWALGTDLAYLRELCANTGDTRTTRRAWRRG